MKARFAVITSLVLISSALAMTATPIDQVTPVASIGEGPVFLLDYTNFLGIDNETFVEFYLQVSYDELQFIKQNRRFHAEYEIDFSVMTPGDSLLENYCSIDAIDLDTYAEAQTNKKARVMLLGYSFPAGSYKIRARMTDRETGATSVLEGGFSPKTFGSPQLGISDIQLSQKIQPATDGEPYVKNGRYIEANASRVFAHGINSDIYVYFEVYHLSYVENCDNSTYTTFISFFDVAGNEFARLQRSKEKPGETSAHSMKFPLQNFPAGAYYVSIRVQDDVGGESCETVRRFSVVEEPVTLTEIKPDKWLY